MEPKLITPAYRVPLKPVDAENVGLFTVIWGQIDFFMGVSIAAMLKVDPGAAQTFMETMTSGPRLNLFFRLARDKIADERILKNAKTFNSSLSALIEKRNHLMHGLWGYYVEGNSPNHMAAAAFYAKVPKRPLLANDLPRMIQEASDLSHAIVEISKHLLGEAWEYDPQNPPSFYFGPGPPPS